MNFILNSKFRSTMKTWKHDMKLLKIPAELQHFNAHLKTQKIWRKEKMKTYLNKIIHANQSYWSLKTYMIILWEWSFV